MWGISVEWNEEMIADQMGVTGSEVKGKMSEGPEKVEMWPKRTGSQYEQECTQLRRTTRQYPDRVIHHLMSE